MNTEPKKRILNLLHGIPTQGQKAVKELFWTELNYPRVNQDLSTRDWSEGAKEVLEDSPTLLAQHAAEGTSFDVIYIKLSEEQKGRTFPLSITAERHVINQLVPNHPLALFLFSDPSEEYWHFVNIKQIHKEVREGSSRRTAQRVFRRISIGPEERLRTAAERISLLDLAQIPQDLFGLSPLEIQKCHDRAFDVQKVTKDFFQNYQTIFDALQQDLFSQTNDKQWAHDYALQFLNRLMFIYYVQRKRWLGDDPYFLDHFWDTYQQSNRPAESFGEEWLSVLFFEAFNNRFQNGRPDRAYLPAALQDDLVMAPFLNGGLFKKNELDQKYSVNISDHQIGQIFNFLNQYNFTISEDTPLDQEVAVDPEMIGKVYESLVNVSEEADEKGDAGIFYTPRVEIDLMSRLSLVDWLTNHLGEEQKNKLYETVFAFSPEEKAKADQQLAKDNLWPELNDLLRDMKVVDPACGSGSFLIGMLYVIDDLLQRANDQLGIEESPYERKKRIIGDSLYGVDVMEWAVHVAELRLWLQLVIETELDEAERQFRPLLPNLSFNIRPGDSLVQEVGDIDFSLVRKQTTTISPHLKGRITQLKGEKRKFYNNASDGKYRSQKEIQQEELNVFRAILDDQIKNIKNQLTEIERGLQEKTNLFGEQQSGQTPQDQAALERKKEQLEDQLQQAAEARSALKGIEDIPFVWDIAFVEVFEGDRSGFDIVIGNPPYVRQENIRDPRQTAEEATTRSKKIYKNKLRDSVYTLWARYFDYDWTRGKNKQHTIGLRSDLYLYFYFHGLALLDEKGSFCFVTSNSWLDVKYGKSLQRFLLTHGKVKLILDNEAYRSFESADVNTIIALFAKPEDRSVPVPESMKHLARFVMLQIPFEQALNPVIWEEIESSSERSSMPEYRVFPRKQEALLESGIDPEKNRFTGDKWGGKYLRAPDIYWEILEKANDKLVRLGDIADVRFGIKTGANDFFYLDEKKIAYWGIEEQYLQPVIKSPRECPTLVINPDKLQYKLFICHKNRESLQNTAALEYIKWGERQGYHNRPTTSSRKRWWDLGDRSAPQIIIPASYNDLYRVFLNTADVLADKRLYEVRFEANFQNAIFASLNSTLTTLFLEILSRTGLGEGLIDLTVYETKLIPIVKPELAPIFDQPENRSILPLRKELSTQERHKMDSQIFDVLDLTEVEREAVYEAVVSLVEQRLQKANSV
jgi:type I restriction-modification system DNA methylase subunit